ncbi:MAG: hypothetical protein ACLFNS_04020 [Desulfobacterales bacterium]
MAAIETGHAKPKTAAKKQVVFWIDGAHADLINEMQAFYRLSHKDDLFMMMIEKFHEYYLSEKAGEGSIEEMITDMQNRLGKLEDKFSRILEPVKMPAKPSKRKPAARQHWAHI